ncbi:DUF1624 domain-containing protein [Schlesneria paludicola]|uniref:DUF1624 domain-containing protein n=1 Tax=Schlesneria paludicola TaxID=360056 RepID=UPI00029A4C76|nr:heparan-alpha-glucosaminide N-acetyltransferase domain-containing protein [Schlesneria paludicola]
MSVDPHSDLVISPTTDSRRLDVVDLLRGIAIILMSLDHVREFLQAEQVNPLNLGETTVALFFTRWITHFCPSIFILLAGVGASLGLSKNKSRFRQSLFLILRGLWLVFLELTVVHVGWFFNLQFQSGVAQVIWAIGWSMVGLGLMFFLPKRIILIFGLLLIFGHNAFDGILSSRFGSFGWIWTVLHAAGPVQWGHFSIYVAYPLIPWMGVMAVGFGFGDLLKKPPQTRSPIIVGIGFGMILLFGLLRGGNLYGDPVAWTPQSSTAFSILSFLNCHKYPPSLSFLLMTLGPVLAFWPLLERWRGPVADFITTFGRVPLFFYLAHLFVIHGLTLAIVSFQANPLPNWLWSFPPGHAGPGCGVTLPYLYLIWLEIVLIHYPLCRIYGSLKKRYPDSLLRFL